jgi:hypothetical protein
LEKTGTTVLCNHDSIGSIRRARYKARIDVAMLFTQITAPPGF